MYLLTIVSARLSPPLRKECYRTSLLYYLNHPFVSRTLTLLQSKQPTPMVKRPKSPDLAEEARYFTVCQPFPLGANWALDQDQQACATWIAECIGLEHLYAIHYKPSVRPLSFPSYSTIFIFVQGPWNDLA